MNGKSACAVIGAALAVVGSVSYSPNCKAQERKAPATATTDKFAIVDTPDYKGVIFTAESAAQDKILGSTHEIFWTPTLEQIAKAETGIAKFLDDSSVKYADRQRKKLKWFRRQYVGYTRDGERRILCNFLPGKESDDPFTDLKKAFLLTHDRGPDYWQIHYRVEKDDCVKFHVDQGF